MSTRPPKPPCSVDGCSRLSLARGWCPMHYNRWKAHGDPLTVFPRGKPFEKRKTDPAVCERVDCGAFVDAKGLCKTHWAQDYRQINNARILAYNQNYDAEHPEVRKGISARQYQKNKPATNARSKARRAANPEEGRRYWQKAQDESMPTASRSGYLWTGWEMELVSDTSRTAPELAQQIGRTMAAVMTMRHNIRHDPQTIARAGLSMSGDL